MGAAGREHVRENFLSTRELEDWLRLFRDLSVATHVIVVSHRGPYRFSRERRRHVLGASAAPAASSARSLPLLDATRDDATWIAAAIADDDRAAVAAGRADDLGVDLHLLALDPTLHRLHYDVVSNGVLWFLHHGLFDLARRPRFDRRFREAWDAYVAVNQAFADAAADGARPTATSCSCRTTSSRSSPRMLRAAPARPARRALHAHAVLRPELDPRAARRTSPTRSARRWRAAPAGFHTARWARAYAASAREVLGAGRRRSRRTFAAPLGPDPDALAAEVGDARGRRTRRAALDERRRRPPADPAHRPHRAVEEHRARLPRVRPAARRRTRSCAGASCSSRC